jgi:hypothetical protein
MAQSGAASAVGAARLAAVAWRGPRVRRCFVRRRLGYLGFERGGGIWACGPRSGPAGGQPAPFVLLVALVLLVASPVPLPWLACSGFIGPWSGDLDVLFRRSPMFSGLSGSFGVAWG